jgi:hypothetical protein
MDEENQGYFGIEIDEIPVNQKVFATHLPYDEVLHTPDAKSESEIKAKAYYFNLSSEEAKDRFGEDVSKKIHWKSNKTTKRSEEKDRETESEDTHLNNAPGSYVEGWECWCEETGYVYWVSNQYVEGFLDEKKNPYGLQGMFPSTKFIIGSKPSKSMYPTPNYIHVMPTISELHKLQNRIFNLITGIRRRALVDGANEELIYALNSLQGGEFVAIENLQSIIEKGGIENLVYWVPVQELVQAIGELQALDEKFKNDHYEWFGVPDILRGTTDPIETATSQEIKQSSAHDRFKFAKKQVRVLARDTIEMQIDLMLGMYSDEKIMRLVGFEFMTPMEQSVFPAALQFLRDDDERSIRIEIETDSMSFLDEQFRAQQMNIAIGTVTQGLQHISQTAQISPDFAKVGLHTLLMGLEVISPGGKDFQGGIKQAVDALIDQIENPPEPPPPPPDYEMMKLEIEGNKAVAQMQAKYRDLDQKQLKIHLNDKDSEQENALKSFEFQLDSKVQEFMMAMEGQRVMIEQQRVQIEEFSAQMQASESQMEEYRLAKEVDTKTLEVLVAGQQEQASKEVQAPPPVVVEPNITIVNEARPKTKTVANMTYDELTGNAQMTMEPTIEDQLAEAVLQDALLNPEGE